MSISDHKIDHTIPIPLYFQLREILLKEIKNKSYPVGDKIPTEFEIQDEFGLSRSTIRQAVNSLVQDGWLERKGNKGTFVRLPKDPVSPIRSFEPFYQQVAKTGKIPKTELLELKVIDPPLEISQSLGLTPEEKVIYIFRKRYADGIAMVTLQNYLPYSLCSFVMSHNFEKESLYEVISSNPVTQICHTKNIISACMATSEDVKLLGVKLNSSILSVNNYATNSKGKIVDYAFARYRGDSNRFEIDVDPPHTN